MNFTRLCAALLLALCTASVCEAAQSIEETFELSDRGQRRAFVVARDEIHRAGRIERIAPQPDIQSLQQQAAKAAPGPIAEADLVLYPAHGPRNETTRRIVTRQIAVTVQPGTDVAALAASVGARVVKEFAFATNTFLLQVNKASEVLAVTLRLETAPGVISVQPQLGRRVAKKLVPNDNFFPQQWHLRNTGTGGGTPGIDVAVTNVWENYRGSGVVIGIVDEGIQAAHPDLAENVNTSLGWDFNDMDAEPEPAPGFDEHGTAVAGVAAARGNNTVGVTGAAFEATLVGLRLLGRSQLTTDATDAAAMSHSNSIIHILNNSWGADDCSFSPGSPLDASGPLMRAAIRNGVRTGRGGKGVIYTFAGGNGRSCGDDVNYDGYANAANVFAIGAVSDRGEQADYSESGACLVCVAPSSSSGRQEIVTTDLIGDDGYNFVGAFGELSNQSYSRRFNGTSSATPLASGVIALILQANPNLSYRDVKEVILRSSTKVQPSDSDWKTNAAGIRHNHKFGAGMIHALSAVTLATNWAYLGEESAITQVHTNLSLPIPDNNTSGVPRLFTFTNAGFRVETITVTLTAPHSSWGDLAVTVTSPSGMESRLAERHNGNRSYQYQAWTFSSVRHWGEAANGVWSVTVSDRMSGMTGTLEAVELSLQGSVPTAELALARTNADMRVTLNSAAAGWRYAIDAAENLTDYANGWNSIGTNTVPASGVISLTDTNAGTLNRRFYRARLLP